jgi:hypothetical protein
MLDRLVHRQLDAAQQQLPVEQRAIQRARAEYLGG